MDDSNAGKSDYEIALERITAEAEARTGRLDLYWLDIEELPEELAGLTHLQSLNCSDTQISDLTPLAGLTNLKSLDCSSPQISDLTPLAGLKNLQSLTCSGSEISDLTTLAGLKSLKSLICSGSEISDLTPLAGLTNLQSLNCAWTRISDLTPLAGLTNLQSLNCYRTRISDLMPLAGLTNLQSLECNSTRIGDLTPLAGLRNLQSLDCSSTRISDLAPLAGLTNLQSLNCSDMQISDLTPLAGLTNLQSLDCDRTQISNLTPLAGLTKLQSLSSYNTEICDLTPLAGLTNLQSLDCDYTRISDLTPLAGLTNLQSLTCSDTLISDLTPLAGLTNLQSLTCSDTLISDLTPLAGLTDLHELVCDNTQISDLTPLAGLINLQELDCYRTQIRDLTSLAGLTNLQSLHCYNTQISDLTPLAGLTNLQSLDCDDTQISDISVIADLPSLTEARFARCPLNTPSLDVIASYPGTLSVTRMADVPPEVLSQSGTADCRDSLFAHLSDVAAGYVSRNQCKLIVLGNGRVGKTQICRQLRGEAYSPAVPSTHGITVTTAELDADRTLNLWDFGGQDIYHGTHGLFMRTRAIFLIAWTPAIEGTMTQTQEDYVFRNYPLAYWLDYVRELSGTELPVIITQTQCDSGQDAVYNLPHIDDRITPFEYKPQMIQFSARTGWMRETLDTNLKAAFKYIQDRYGASVIGLGRLEVIRQLEAMRDEDAARPEDKRLYRTLSQARFHEMCEATGNVVSPEQFLRFLHNCGIVFYQKGLFSDEIVLDQGWALNAIYTVFDRDNCLRSIRGLNGCFRRDLLGELVWKRYGPAEQELFLSMMVACGICFIHRRGNGYGDTEYIAPDLLPDEAAISAELAWRWKDDRPFTEVILTYPLLHDGLMRGVLSRLGAEAGLNGLYWKGGICLFDTTSGSCARIDQHVTEGWQGNIHIRVQEGRNSDLLEALREIVEAEAEKIGLRHKPTDPAPPPTPSTRPDADAPASAPEYGTPPHSGRKWYVSYAWGDDTPEGLARDASVEGMQTQGRARSIDILRDKDMIHYGDRLSKFMLGLTRGERIFVILSDKYLKSAACMYELYEIWRQRGEDADLFKHDVRTFILSCARIFSFEDRAAYAIYWTAKRKTIAAMIEEHGSDFLGIRGYQEYRRISEFAAYTNDILTVIADTWQPRSLDDFYNYAFD